MAISFSSQCSHVSNQHWRGSGAEFVGILPSCHCKRDAVGSCYGTPAMFFWKTPCAFEKLPHFLHLALKPAANLRNTYNITPPNYGPVSGVIEMLTYLFFFLLLPFSHKCPIDTAHVQTLRDEKEARLISPWLLSSSFGENDVFKSFFTTRLIEKLHKPAWRDILPTMGRRAVLLFEPCVKSVCVCVRAHLWLCVHLFSKCCESEDHQGQWFY